MAGWIRDTLKILPRSRCELALDGNDGLHYQEPFEKSREKAENSENYISHQVFPPRGVTSATSSSFFPPRKIFQLGASL